MDVEDDFSIRLRELATTFLGDLLSRMAAQFPDLFHKSKQYQADHICYRPCTMAEYKTVCIACEKAGFTCLTESMVNGRPISTFSLPEPFKCGSLEIPCIEIPSPPKGDLVRSGFQHVEFVIGELCEPCRS